MECFLLPHFLNRESVGVLFTFWESLLENEISRDDLKGIVSLFTLYLLKLMLFQTLCWYFPLNWLHLFSSKNDKNLMKVHEDEFVECKLWEKMLIIFNRTPQISSEFLFRLKAAMGLMLSLMALIAKCYWFSWQSTFYIQSLQGKAMLSWVPPRISFCFVLHHKLQP